MRQIFYKKEGRKYIAVSEYDDKFTSSVGYGDYLLSVYPNGSFRKRIDPAFAPMIAAGMYSRDAVAAAVQKSVDMRPRSSVLTEGQRSAWELLKSEFNDEVHALIWPAAQSAVDAAVESMTIEANMLLSNIAVKNAYDEFMLVCKLTKESI